jgi:hypothetical protein
MNPFATFLIPLLILFTTLAFTKPTTTLPRSKKTSTRSLLRPTHKSRTLPSRYSPNWAGAYIYPTPKRITSISSYITIPPLNLRPNATDGSYAFNMWLGLDGFSQTSSLFQAGLTIDVLKKGNNVTKAAHMFYEWVPGPYTPIAAKEFEVKEGDRVGIYVFAKNSTRGLVVLVNERSQKIWSRKLMAPYRGALKGESAEWIVERLSINGKFAIWPVFETVNFTSCRLEWNGGSGGLEGTKVMMIEEEGVNLAEIDVEVGMGKVAIKYLRSGVAYR